MEFFLKQKGIDEDHRIQIIDVIFQNADADGNNEISLDEFVQHYVDTKNQLVEREKGIIFNIKETNARLREAKVQLAQSIRNPNVFETGFAGQLQIQVIRAEGLTNIRTSHVVVRQADSFGRSRQQDGPAPNYDRDTLIRFDVLDEQQPIIFSIIDSQRDVSVMDTQIAFEDILNNQIPIDEEFWLNVREEDLAAPKLRIRLIYQQDQIYRLKNEADYYENDLRENVGILSQVRAFIQQLRTPFGYLKYDIDQANY